MKCTNWNQNNFKVSTPKKSENIFHMNMLTAGINYINHLFVFTFRGIEKQILSLMKKIIYYTNSITIERYRTF